MAEVWGWPLRRRCASAASSFCWFPQTVSGFRPRRGKGFESAQVDFTDDEALKAIGIGSSATTIFCLFEEMSNNFFLTLSARTLAPELTIISISSSAASSSKLIAAGANKTIDPYVLTGRWIHNLIRRPLVVETLYGILLGTPIWRLVRSP